MLALRKKVSSEKGASITFALLLFLVCAIISSIVIVAATAVGGRASKMAEMDQRYYAVNSAAELLRDVLEAPEMTVVTGTEKVTPITLGKDMNQISTGTATETNLGTEITMDGEPVPNDDTSLLTVAALNLAGVSSEALVPTLLTAAANTGTLDTTGLAVTITPLLAGEKLTFNISNTDQTKGAYTLRLTFKADITRNTDTQTTYGTKKPLIIDGKIIADQYTTEKTLTEKKITTVRWKLVDLVTAGTES